MSLEAKELAIRRGATQDVVLLISLYEQLEQEGKRELLASLALSLTAYRLPRQIDPNDEVDIAYDWLTDLAESTRPKYCHVGALLGLAEDAEPEWRSMAFPDGLLAMLVCPSDDVYTNAEGVYEGYMAIRDNADVVNGPPKPAEYLQVKVPRSAFMSQQEGSSDFDKDAWTEEVRGKCIDHFVEYVARWRAAFFRALLSGVQSG